MRLDHDTSRFLNDDLRGVFGTVGEIEIRNIVVRYDKELLPRIHDVAPAITNEHDWSAVENARLKFVPDKRHFRHRSHPATERDEADRSCYKVLQPIIEMVGRNFVGEVTVGFAFELVHHDPEYSSTRFTSATGRGFHHAEIAAGADGETGLSESRTDLAGLAVFVRIGPALRAAENCYDPVV